jgi:hypothetical protein
MSVLSPDTLKRIEKISLGQECFIKIPRHGLNDPTKKVVAHRETVGLPFGGATAAKWIVEDQILPPIDDRAYPLAQRLQVTTACPAFEHAVVDTSSTPLEQDFHPPAPTIVDDVIGDEPQPVFLWHGSRAPVHTPANPKFFMISQWHENDSKNQNVRSRPGK